MNPNWQAGYTPAQNTERLHGVLIDVNNAFIISDCHSEDTRAIDHDSGKVICRTPRFQTFGASANAITIRLFHQTDTIGASLNALKSRLIARESPDELIDEAYKTLGESVEKVLFVNHALDAIKQPKCP